MHFKLGNTSFIYQVKLPEKPEKLAKLPPKWQSNLCYKCRRNEKNVVVNPCSHFCLCFECSLTADKCYLCERTIAEKIRIYPSWFDPVTVIQIIIIILIYSKISHINLNVVEFSLNALDFFFLHDSRLAVHAYLNAISPNNLNDVDYSL